MSDDYRKSHHEDPAIDQQAAKDLFKEIGKLDPDTEVLIESILEVKRYTPGVISMGADAPLYGGMRPDSDGAWLSRIEVAKRLRAVLSSKGDKANTPVDGVGVTVGDDDRMEKISEVITHLQSIQERFGDTCVYIRRGGMSWGAVALNRRYDDKKHGVFDLQAQHDRDMAARLEQVQRLINDNRELRAQLAATHPAPSASREVTEADDWQPIETAPPGQQVLVWERHYGWLLGLKQHHDQIWTIKSTGNFYSAMPRSIADNLMFWRPLGQPPAALLAALPEREG